MVLYIKNMVCQRCVMVVKAELEQLGLHPRQISLGEGALQEDVLPPEQLEKVASSLEAVGFELIDDKKSRLIEQIKTFIIDSVHHQDEPPTRNYSELLSRHLHHDYSYLSNLFSSVEGMTIEHFIIHQKIEKAKELLVYKEVSLADIAFQLGYSSISHLSTQFKKMTGFTPSQFKQLRNTNRKDLDKITKPK